MARGSFDLWVGLKKVDSSTNLAALTAKAHSLYDGKFAVHIYTHDGELVMALEA